MQKFKKSLYCVVSLLMAVCLLSLFVFSAKDSAQPVQSWNSEEIENTAEYIGYTKKTDAETGNTIYHSLFGISHIILPYNESDFNTVIVTLSEPITADDEDETAATPLLYYNTDEHGYFVYDNFCEPLVSDDGKTLIFRTYYTDSKNTIALKLDGNFAIDTVTVYMVESTSAILMFNPIALLSLLIILLVLLLVERKFRYFSWVAEHIRRELDVIKKLREGKKSTLRLHLAALISAAVFIITTAVLIIFNKFTYATTVVVFVLAIATVVLQLTDRIRSGRNASVAKLFLVVTVLVGILFCYTSPPSTHTAWDDEIHFRFAYLFANGSDGAQSLAEYKLFTHSYTINDYVSDPSYFAKVMVTESDIPLTYELDPVQPYTLISYTPMVLMSALMRLLQTDIIKTLLLCRLANLFAWALITYMGIKKLKNGALIFSAVCMMPGVIYLGCSFSYDMWLTAWLVYAFAYFISELQQPDKKLTTADTVKLLLAFFIGCSAKAVYCVMMLPLLFFGKNKFTDKTHARRFRMLVVLVMVIIIAMLIIPGLFTPDMYSDSRGGSDVSSSGQLMFILSNPLYFIKVMLRHLSEYCSLSRFNTHSSAFGYLDGYDGSTYPFFGTLAAVIIIFCIFTDNRENDSYKLMGKQRVVTLLTCVLQVVIISATMYLAFNNIGSSVINGCQFRYLFPLFAPVFFFARPKRICYGESAALQSALVFGALTLNLLLGYFVTYVYRFCF